MPLEQYMIILNLLLPAGPAMVKQRLGPLATPGTQTNFLIQKPMGAVLPVLHLNGYKIANPQCWPVSEPEELISF